MSIQQARGRFDYDAARKCCRNCGLPGHQHDKERVTEDGMFYYEYHCPEEPREAFPTGEFREWDLGDVGDWIRRWSG